MKLPIKKIYFDQIKNGKKIFEYRDAHITFINEETKEELRKDVLSVELINIRNLIIREDLTLKEIEKLFSDNWIICFKLK